jgi:uncharacterized protein (UPF0212 family)
MITFHMKCPHCAAYSEVELSGRRTSSTFDANELPTQRMAAIIASTAPEFGDEIAVLELYCSECRARIAVDFVVRERPLVAVLSRTQLVALRAEGKRFAVKIRKAKRAARETPPPMSCPGCYREYGEAAGYPEPLPTEGLCAVCSQELKRRLFGSEWPSTASSRRRARR